MSSTEYPNKDVVVIGGGPAGLTCAYELLKRAPNSKVQVFEGSNLLGGISRTEAKDGFRVDIGGHRFFTKVAEVEQMWHDVLGTDFIRVQRLSRIYYKDKFYDYPLKLMNALGNLGLYESMRIMASFAKWRVRPHKEENNFEEWVINRFGGRLYMHFFASYTKKVWGISPKLIQADWAAQRIKDLSLRKIIWNAISGANESSSLIEEFNYPRLGPGMMWEKTADVINAGNGEVKINSYVEKVERQGNRVVAVHVKDADGSRRVEGSHFVNSMDLRTLLGCMNPPPPPAVQDAAAKLAYRDFLIVAMVLNTAEPFPDNWIYVHAGDVRVGRIQNFRAWSTEMVPNENQCLVGMEYFCNQGDDLWEMSDDDLGALAAKEIERLGLAKASDKDWSFVVRQLKAYPVYDTKYKGAVDVIADWINSFENFQTVGRNGLHRYNNQDHSMLTGMLAAGNILGETHDLWEVNVERSYHEEFQREEEEDLPATTEYAA